MADQGARFTLSHPEFPIFAQAILAQLGWVGYVTALVPVSPAPGP
jgi:hypothetical protein